jgi:hypothetical protein
MKIRFLLTEEHIELLSRAYVNWQNCETGAPEIDPKRPYGNSSVALDVCEILELAENDKNEEIALNIHRETAQALQIILITQQFLPGLYEKQDEYDSRSWKLIKRTKQY